MRSAAPVFTATPPIMGFPIAQNAQNGQGIFSKKR
jgi:hypothetical protein